MKNGLTVSVTEETLVLSLSLAGWSGVSIYNEGASVLLRMIAMDFRNSPGQAGFEEGKSVCKQKRMALKKR